MDSVFAQDYPHFEYVVIDGGSSDGTVDILGHVEDSRLRWISEPDKGIFDAWNKGLALAQGEWITFIGADDVLFPHALSSMMSLAAANPKAQYLSCKMEWVGSHGKRYILGRAWSWPRFQRYNCTAHPGSMHHRELFREFGTYDSSLRIVGDYELLLRPGKNLRSAFLPDVLSRMQGGGNSDNAAALDEAALVKVRTGKRPAWLVALELALAHWTFRARIVLKSVIARPE